MSDIEERFLEWRALFIRELEDEFGEKSQDHYEEVKKNGFSEVSKHLNLECLAISRRIDRLKVAY